MIVNIDTTERLQKISTINQQKDREKFSEIISLYNEYQACIALGIPTSVDIKELQGRVNSLLTTKENF